MALRFLLLAFIVAINGFFAAAEVSLVSVRRSRLKQLADEGSVPAKAALQLLANPEGLLSVTQVGVTLGEPRVGLGGRGQYLPAYSRHAGASRHREVGSLSASRQLRASRS